MRLSIGAILMVTVPETIMRSECRGEAKGTMPRRSTSKREAKVAIISMAQQARPKVTGHALEEPGVLVALRPLLVELLPLLEILELGPDGGGNLRGWRLYFHSRMPSRSA